MGQLCESEFADEYQDWLSGHPGAVRAAWFDLPVFQLCGPALQVEPTISLRQVLKLMSAQQRAAALVVRARRLLGIFTQHDVLHKVALPQRDLDDTSVGALMTPCPETLPETTTLAQALRMMVRSRHRHLPVVDGVGQPLALISMREIVEFVSDVFPKEILNAPPEHQLGLPLLDGA